jgi:zinc finger CCHC domain-containing protein 9
MTRFARIDSKNSKKKQDATKWEEMSFDKNETKKLSTNKDSNANSFKQINSFNNNNKTLSNNNNNNKKGFDMDVNKISRLVDSDVLKNLKRMKDNRQISQHEFVSQLKKEAKRNQRRLSRKSQRENTKVCFRCRKNGHNVQECPQIKQDQEQGTGICYKCGSTEHSVKQCKLKIAPGYFPYAKCYICNETGHLSKQCPDNPRGLYPNGGSCKNCDSVEHYAKDCPTLEREDNNTVNLKTVTKLRPFDNVDEIPDLDDTKKQLSSNDEIKLKNKIIKF